MAADWRGISILALTACGVIIQAGAQEAPCVATLTESKPKAACSVSTALLARPPRLVEVPVTKIQNPSGQSFSIHLYLAGAKTTPELIGNVTVFPPDRTGVFMIRSQAAFDRFGASRAPVRIVIEIRRTSGSEAFQPISVSIGPLRWLYEEPK
jgi:hypothetical protein